MKKINVAILAILFIGSTGNLLRASENQENSDLIEKSTAISKLDIYIVKTSEAIKNFEKMPITNETKEALNLSQKFKSMLEQQKALLQSGPNFIDISTLNPLDQNGQKTFLQLQALMPELTRQYHAYITASPTPSIPSSSSISSFNSSVQSNSPTQDIYYYNSNGQYVGETGMYDQHGKLEEIN